MLLLTGVGGAFAPAAAAGFANGKSLTGRASSYLQRTSGTGTTTKFAFSIWVRTPASFTAQVHLWGASSAGDQLYVNPSGQPGWLINNGSNGEQWASAALATSAWSHVLYWWDSANATAGDRMRMWINGTEVSAFGRDTNPGLSAATTQINVNTTNLRVGFATNSVHNIPNTWLIDEIAFFDNNLPAVTDVRDSGTSKPKDLSALTFGSQGWWLRFEGGTAATYGNESSGTGNNFTVTGYLDADSSTTVP